MTGDVTTLTSGSEGFEDSVLWLHDKGVDTFGVAAVVVEHVSDHLCRFQLIRNAEGEVPFRSEDLGLAERIKLPSFLQVA